ncbi:MAG: hypothetical protein ACI9W2_001480 [Gammaproteobacteria bacterium]
MKRYRALIWAGIAVTALAILIVSLFEWRTVAQEKHFTGEAKSNPLLAARRALRRLGVEASTVRTLGARGLEAAVGDTLLVVGVDRLDLPRVAGRFGQWLDDGGHLVVALDGGYSGTEPDAESGAELDDDVNEATDVERVPPQWQGWWRDISQGLEVISRARPALREGVVSWRNSSTSVGVSEPRAIKVRSRHYFTVNAPWESGSACAARRSYGLGQLTLLCESRFLFNENLGEADHARLLWDLVVDERLAVVGTKPARVWLVLGVEYPGLWEWLVTRVPYGFIGLAFAIGIWLLVSMRRFGPVLETERPRRRNVLEQVEAAGRFMWRRGARGRLLEPMLELIERRATLHYRGFHHFTDAEREQALEALSGEAGTHVSKLFARRDNESRYTKASEFVSDIRALERVRRTL